ncbi:uncharacterized protein G2W53_035277 [Senna tora]|uniref:Uncharacterized protein n=1 Tax=Senna tora TaxID=362788 RepID=A0A834W932_9FABA|nr:uncharacterized protein G2W53_035277 [Senna tora]
MDAERYVEIAHRAIRQCVLGSE